MQEISENREVVLKGLAINSGKIVADVCLYSVESHLAVKEYRLGSEDAVSREIMRFENALAACSADLEKISRQVKKDVGKSESEIFRTQKHIMNDPLIVNAIRKGIREDRVNVERVISNVYGEYEKKFSLLDDEYMRERSTDIGELRRRLLDNLYNTKPGFQCRGQKHCSRGRNRIIVAAELTADMMVRMNLGSVLGIVTEHGGISSHAAVIARSVGIPAVSGVRGIMDIVECGMILLVDGDDGRVFINPDAETVKRLIPEKKAGEEDVCLLVSPAGFQVMANASIIEDVKMAASVRADGIGLFRTEIEFMRADRLLTEDEQFKLYKSVMDAMPGLPVTFRLIDVGGDKQLPFFRIEKEDNPFLGWRGARFLLGSPDILNAQVRALVRLSAAGRVRIMFPMIIDSVQTARLCDSVREIIVTAGGISENISLGAMFEVPSACMQAGEIFKQVDFGSIGSNDLIQYLFAVDRNNEMVSSDYNPDHPVLWQTLEMLSRTAKAEGKPLSICGEMAGREGVASRLAKTGINSLSVSARLVVRVRNELVKNQLPT
jgi:phosphotransferase system enzyme I (PtsI)